MGLVRIFLHECLIFIIKKVSNKYRPYQSHGNPDHGLQGLGILFVVGTPTPTNVLDVLEPDPPMGRFTASASHAAERSMSC